MIATSTSLGAIAGPLLVVRRATDRSERVDHGLVTVGVPAERDDPQLHLLADPQLRGIRLSQPGLHPQRTRELDIAHRERLETLLIVTRVRRSRRPEPLGREGPQPPPARQLDLLQLLAHAAHQLVGPVREDHPPIRRTTTDQRRTVRRPGEQVLGDRHLLCHHGSPPVDVAAARPAAAVVRTVQTDAAPVSTGAPVASDHSQSSPSPPSTAAPTNSSHRRCEPSSSRHAHSRRVSRCSGYSWVTPIAPCSWWAPVATVPAQAAATARAAAAVACPGRAIATASAASSRSRSTA